MSERSLKRMDSGNGINKMLDDLLLQVPVLD